MEEVAISEAVEVEEEVEAVEAEEEQQAGLDLIDDSMELDSQIMMSKSTKCFTLLMLPNDSYTNSLLPRSESSGSEAESAPEDEVMEDVDSDTDDDDEDEQTSSKPYMALLQSFTENNAPKAKRRKLEHQEAQRQPEESSDDEEEADEEAEEKDIDRAEEEPEDQDAEEQIEDDDDSEDEDNLTDPFDTHFAHPDDDTVAKRVKAVQKGEWATKRALIQNLRATVTYPNSDAGSEVPKPMAGLDSLSLKQKLKETAARKIGEFDTAQRAFSPLLFNYSDVLHCDRTVRNSDSLRKLTCLHALNHVFK